MAPEQARSDDVVTHGNGNRAYDHVPRDETTLRRGLTMDQVIQRTQQYGLNRIPAPHVPLYMIFVRQFTGFLPLCIAAAAFVSLAVEDITDFGIIVTILVLNACLGFREELHAKRALDELSAELEAEIQVKRENHVSTVHVSQLVPGDLVLLVNGTLVPADVVWVRGDTLSMDTAALTGETQPRKYPSTTHGSEILSGMTVLAGEAYAQVVRTGLQTEMGKAHANVLRQKSVRVVSVFQQKVMRIVQWLLVFSVIVVLTVFFIQGVVYDGFQDNVKETILDALSILIASIPVALPLVLQINLALGASFLARQHAAIVTSIPALQDIASMSMLCSDKTGTLTTAQMTVPIDKVVSADDTLSATDVLRYTLLCSNADKQDDPIDRAVCQAAQTTGVTTTGYQQNKLYGFNPANKRVVAICTTPDGQIITVAKGLPEKILNTGHGGVDDAEIQWKVQGYDNQAMVSAFLKQDESLNESGYKTIAVAMCRGDARTMSSEEAQWTLVGLVPLLDPPREDTPATIAALHHANISVQMITGDHAQVGKETARLIGLGTTNFYEGQDLRSQQDVDAKRDMIWHADGFCTVLPSDKQEIVMTLKDGCGLVTGMTGDGVNDVAALSAAHVGIAVQGATDAAKNAADLVLTRPGLGPIYGAVLESRRIFARIKSYVVYRVAASIGLVLSLSIVLFATGCACDPLLIIILALINDVSMIPVAYDNASATTEPQLPHAKKLVLMSLYFGVLHTVLALFFIFSMLDLDKLADLEECDIQSRGFIWLYMILFTEFMIFSVRSPSYFWQSKPSLSLVISVVFACLLGTVLIVYRNDLNREDVGWLWAWNVAAFFVVDFGKVCFRQSIGDLAGETIESDALLPPPAPKSESTLQQEKRARLSMQAHLKPSDTTHNVQVGGGGAAAGYFTDGIVNPIRRLTALKETGAAPPLGKEVPQKKKKSKKNEATFKTPETELA